MSKICTSEKSGEASDAKPVAHTSTHERELTSSRSLAASASAPALLCMPLCQRAVAPTYLPQLQPQPID